MEDLMAFCVGLFDVVAGDASPRCQRAGLSDPNALESHRTEQLVWWTLVAVECEITAGTIRIISHIHSKIKLRQNSPIPLLIRAIIQHSADRTSLPIAA